ncbi:hypothetical protein F0562_017299 [Nyssa sinensis]|uniref:Phytocyanin domain-containing protein n=1 Tax=Nyssa sinensis TaxID=561372 RepID=A0A5J4ZE44_9ASTE|nr:hypothetical protein F0562_017299 [Nyssa sinensis]
MALRSIFIILAIIFPAMVLAKDFMVGDYKGWTNNFNYQAWAQGKNFRVGDRLVFKYPVGMHNVFKVNGTGFQNCIKPPLSQALTSGQDIIVLATPVFKYPVGMHNVFKVNGTGFQNCIKPPLSQALTSGKDIIVLATPGNKWSIFIILAIIFPAMVLAKDFMVGDYKGWTNNFNYQAWAQGKNFRVGDRLVFKYPVGMHNVFKVNGTGFQNCIKPPLSQALTSGKDIIVLATPGNKWYLCGVGNHCAFGGQKLAITVQS